VTAESIAANAAVIITETVYRHEIRPALTKGATAMDEIFRQAPKTAWHGVWSPAGPQADPPDLR
jgi:hypothetical protein